MRQHFHEFISEDIGETLISSDGVVMSYSLNVPIKDEGKFQNSQVDAIMTGEISLAKRAMNIGILVVKFILMMVQFYHLRIILQD